MNSDVVVPVAASVIAALASIGGVLYSQNATLQVEQLKWEQGRRDDFRKSAGAALAELAKELSVAVQRTSFILWQVEMTPDALRFEDFAAYDKETKIQMPKIVASQILLATASKQTHDRLLPLINSYWALDERISIAGRNFRTNRTAGLKALMDDVKTKNRLESQLIRDFAAAGESLTSFEAPRK
jgi:hypothetical protein